MSVRPLFKGCALTFILYNCRKRDILEHFDQKTRRRGQSYEYKVLENVKEVAKNKRIKEQKKTHRLSGFNSISVVRQL